MSTAETSEAAATQVVTGANAGPDNDRNAKAFRCQKVFDQALRWIKMAGSTSDRIQPLLKEAYELALEVHGERDLKTARIGWQLASTLLTSGLTDQAVPLLQSVQKTREALLPDTSDELYDVYADLSYVHMSKAQQSSNHEKQADEFRQAMDLAQKAKAIVKKNANSSTTDRYYSRQCLISSRLGSIHRAQGQHAESIVEFEQALQSAERLAMDQDKNVKLRVHVILERASAELHKTSMQLAQTKRKSTKLTSSTSSAGATAPAATTAATVPAVTTTMSRSAADLYSQAINLLKEHHLEEMPFMAQAQAGLALVLMADADTLHQEMLKDKSNKKSATTSTTASISTASSASLSPTASPTASTASSLSPSPTPPAPSTSSSTSAASTASEKTALIKQLLNQSVQLTTDAMKLYQTIGGEESHDVATMCYNLGSLYVRLDEVSSARTYLNRSLELRKKLYGPSHPSVLQVEIDLKKIKSIPDTTPVSARLQRRSTMPNTANGNTTTTNATTATTSSSPAASPLASGRRRNFVPAAAASGTTAKAGLNPVPPPMPAASGSLTSRPAVNRARTSAPLPSSGSQSARGTAVVAARALKASKSNAEPAPNAAVATTAITATPALAASTITEPSPSVTASAVITAAKEADTKPVAALPAVATTTATTAVTSTPVIAAPISPVTTSDSMVVTINPQSATTTTTTTSVVSLTPTLTVVSTEVSTTCAADMTENAVAEKKKPLSRPSSSKTYIIHRSASKGALPTASTGTSSIPTADATPIPAPVVIADSSSAAASTTTTAIPTVSTTPVSTVDSNSSVSSVVVNPARASGKYILRPKSAIRVMPASGPVTATPIASSQAPSSGVLNVDKASPLSSGKSTDVVDVKTPTEQKHAPVACEASTPVLPTKKANDEERKESDATQTPASSDVAPPMFNPQFLSF